MAGSRDVIYAAIHSAFVKYPKEDDPASHDHWIQPEEATHSPTPTMTLPQPVTPSWSLF